MYSAEKMLMKMNGHGRYHKFFVFSGNAGICPCNKVIDFLLFSLFNLKLYRGIS